MSNRRKFKWEFPLTRTHCGILQGNGTFGAMIWGDKKLHITLNRADFWDRRGGMPFTEEMTYTNIRECLEAGDEERLRKLFEGTPPEPGQPRRPSVLPLGRLEIDFGENTRIRSGVLNTKTGEVKLKVERDGRKFSVVCVLLMNKPCLYLSLEDGLSIESITRKTAWDYVGEHLSSISFDPPEMFDGGATSLSTAQIPPNPPLQKGGTEEAAKGGTEEAAKGGTEGASKGGSEGAAESINPSASPGELPSHPENTGDSGGQSPPGEKLSGWTQMRPADPHICLGYRQVEDGLVVTAIYGNTAAEAKGAAEAVMDHVVSLGFQKVRQDNRRWWRSYWRDVPFVNLPSEDLGFIYYYGMYKFAGLTNPDGVAATLQGPWVEEYQMPPWSSDYHFNINVQECYWPTFAGNRLEHIRPLFDLIKSWEDKLRHNANVFLGIEDGLMLPHSVDDRCVCMGGFWTGSIDHGSTAWVAQLMWLYYRYSMDEAFLRETAYPFMKGAMRVYEEMLEDKDGELSLPVSVSPEYNGASMNAWGKNASFQLSLIHFLCRSLCEAADILGVDDDDEKWQDIDRRVPEASLIDGRIALWEGQDLEHSHRHHSHLAGIYPFDTIDYGEGEQKQIIERSITHWVRKGIGEWSGWCIPWASIIHSRMNNAEAAEMLLQIWRRFFTNEGHGTLHDVNYPGISTMGMGRSRDKSREIMQIEAGMAAITAVQEMLVQNVKGVIRIFAGVPESWKSVSFRGMRAEGAFLIDAKRKAGRTVRVKVLSEKGSHLKMENNMAETVLVKRRGREEVVSGEIIELDTREGETIMLVPAVIGGVQV